ncbi:MAG TPA: CvpA family protein [Pontiella sp.]
MPYWLSWVDIVFAGAVLLFAWRGSQNGFAAQVAHILTFIAMGICLFFAYPFLFNYLGRVFRDVQDSYWVWLLLAGTVAVAIGVFKLMARLLAKWLEREISATADCIWGFILGLSRGALFCMIIMIFSVLMDGSHTTYESFRAKSYVGKTVCNDLIPHIQPRLSKAVLGEKVQSVRDRMRGERDSLSNERQGN